MIASEHVRFTLHPQYELLNNRLKEQYQARLAREMDKQNPEFEAGPDNVDNILALLYQQDYMKWWRADVEPLPSTTSTLVSSSSASSLSTSSSSASSSSMSSTSASTESKDEFREPGMSNNVVEQNVQACTTMYVV
jgi:hypothetical protein